MAVSKFMLTLSAVKYYLKSLLGQRVPFVPFFKVQKLSDKYGLPYQIAALYQFGNFMAFRGKNVLEVGGSSFPEELLFDRMRVERWVSIDYLDFWWTDECIKRITTRPVFECPVVPMSDVNGQNTSGRHVIISGSINDLPENFNGQFDAAVSIATLEHLSDLAGALARIYDTLRPHGIFCAQFGPIWSGPNGHHLAIDNKINFKISEQFGITPHEHLLNTPDEFRAKFESRFEPELLDLIISNIYDDKTTNRLFYEDYLRIFDASAFRSYKIFPIRRPVPKNVLSRLRERYPNYKDFTTFCANICMQK